MTQLMKRVFLVLLITIGITGTWKVASALRHDSVVKDEIPTKISVEHALKMQRDIARVQRFGVIVNNLQMQFNQADAEIKADREELQSMAKELKINYDDLVNNKVTVSDDGTLVRPKTETPLPQAEAKTDVKPAPTSPAADNKPVVLPVPGPKTPPQVNKAKP
jgi:hypothetical protein